MIGTTRDVKAIRIQEWVEHNWKFHAPENWRKCQVFSYQLSIADFVSHLKSHFPVASRAMRCGYKFYVREERGQETWKS
jgi:hypothetical protein